jgi:tetratricopeptide (TPR) repeat protein
MTSPEHRKHITVAREQVLDDTLQTLRSNSRKRSKHHFLFIGPRGIGKTHLLSLIEDEIAADEELADQYVVARFPEESSRTLSFADFLLGLCEILKDVIPDEPIWEELYNQLQTEEDNATIVDSVVPIIRKENRRLKRTILITLENIHDVFTNQVRNRVDVAAFRKFLMGENRCLLIATAPMHFDGITDIDQPLYDFFDTQVLDNLSEQQTLDLIKLNLKWDQRADLLAEFATLRPRLLALYRMTGGSPRLIIMLYELIAHESIMSVQEQFQILLDRITPFYQDRLRDLSPQERAVVETMAVMRDQEKTPGAIAARMRMKPQQISSLLKRMSESRYLKSVEHPKDRRSRLYTIREGFFDIWLAMNLSRGARKRLPFLLQFFSIFYPSLEAREQKRIELRQKQEHGDADAQATLDYLSEVGDDVEKVAAKMQLAVHYSQHGDTQKSQDYLTEARPLASDPLGTWITERIGNETATDYLSELENMVQSWDKYRSGDMEAFGNRLVELGESLTYRTWSEARVEFLLDNLKLMPDAEQRIKLRADLGGKLMELARWREAESQLTTARDEAEALSDPPTLAYALNNLAALLEATNRLSEAEPLMRRALAINEQSYGAEHPNVASCLNNLAQLLQATNRLSEAEPLMRRALAIDKQSYGAEHPNVAVRLNNLAQLLQDTNRLAEAEPLMRRALAIDEQSYGAEHPKVAVCLNNLAQLLKATNRLAEAEPLMRRALAIDEQSYGAEHPRVATDLNNLAQLLQATNRLAEAEPLMRRALAIMRSSFGDEHPSTVTVGQNLEIMLNVKGA